MMDSLSAMNAVAAGDLERECQKSLIIERKAAETKHQSRQKDQTFIFRRFQKTEAGSYLVVQGFASP